MRRVDFESSIGHFFEPYGYSNLILIFVCSFYSFTHFLLISKITIFKERTFRRFCESPLYPSCLPIVRNANRIDGNYKKQARHLK